jgi:flagellar biosynthesis chaperone FliJ
MKRFDFQLQPLLHLSRQKERLIELKEKQLRADIEQARQQQTALAKRVMESADRLGKTARSTTSVADFVTQCDFERATINQIAKLEDNVESLTSSLAETVQERLTQRQETQSLETLRQNRWQTWRKDGVRAAQEQLIEQLVRPVELNSADEG